MFEKFVIIDNVLKVNLPTEGKLALEPKKQIDGNGYFLLSIIFFVLEVDVVEIYLEDTCIWKATRKGKDIAFDIHPMLMHYKKNG